MKKKMSAGCVAVALLGCAAPVAQARTWDIRISPGRTIHVPAPLELEWISGSDLRERIDCYSADGKTKYVRTTRVGNPARARDSFDTFWTRRPMRLPMARYFPFQSVNGALVNVSRVTVLCRLGLAAS